MCLCGVDLPKKFLSKHCQVESQADAAHVLNENACLCFVVNLAHDSRGKLSDESTKNPGV